MHTPTPWKAETIHSYTNGEPVEIAIRSEDYDIALVDIEGEDIDQQFANAEFIVHAVNNHDGLQATISRLTAERDGLRKALEFYRDGFRYHPKRTRTGVDLSVWRPTAALLDDCGNIAKAALATPSPSDADRRGGE